MQGFLDIQTLIWLFPVAFILHDFEEIIMGEKWLKSNPDIFHKKLPTKLADRVLKQFSMSTAQFAVAVLVIFLFVSSSTFMASQYINQGSFGNIYYFTAMILALFVHVFTHVGQSILFRSITPGVVTAVIIVLPYSYMMLQSLFQYEVIDWHTLFVIFPYIFLIIPVVLIAHWIGKKLI